MTEDDILCENEASYGKNDIETSVWSFHGYWAIYVLHWYYLQPYITLIQCEWKKKVMLARAIRIYGGPIGLDFTGVLARMVMLWWDNEYLAKLSELGIKMEMYKRYVDD